MSGLPRPDGPVRVGISTCLLGAAVRFDGGHKRDTFLADMFSRDSSISSPIPVSS